MEGLGDALRSALEAARASTESIQGLVQLEVWLSQTATGEPRYADPVGYQALVQEGLQQHTTRDGRTITVRARVSFFPDPVVGIPPAINTRDRLTLPSGLAARIVEVTEGLSDPQTGTQLVRNVWLG